MSAAGRIHGIYPAATILIFISMVDSAATEVCDKEAPWWNPAGGRISIVQELISVLFTPYGLVLVLLLAAAFVFRLRRLGWLGAALAFSLAVLLGWVWMTPDLMEQAAVREGCRTGYPTDFIVLVTLALAFLAIGMRARRPIRTDAS